MQAKDPNITAEELIKAVCYDPETGIFTRKKTRSRSSVGSILGIKNAKGYLRFDVLGHKNMRAHRLAWFYCCGRWPLGILDHINGDPSDNRIANLREASPEQSMQHRRPTAPNKLGYRGVYAKGSGFVGRVEAFGRTYRTRQFSTPREAHEAREAMAKELHREFFKPLP